MKTLRVGKIDFANCTPLFTALEESGCAKGLSFVTGVPTELNEMLESGEIDVAPSSSVQALADPKKFGYLPDLSISSIGSVGSVMLFSEKRLGRLDGETVLLPGESATSVMLLRVLTETLEKTTPVYSYDAERPTAKLLIGDRALRESASERFPYVCDLGQRWFELTGTPFVFGLWIVRRESYKKNPHLFCDLYRRLLRARHLAYRSYSRYAKNAPEAAWMGEKRLLDYWQTISYDLTRWHMEGLSEFAKRAHSLNLLPSDRVPEPLDTCWRG